MAFDFGTGKQVDFGSPNMPVTDAITVMAWCYTRNIANNLFFISRTDQSGTGTDHEFSLGLRTGGSGRLRHRLTVNGTTSTISSSSSAIATNTWFHTAITWSSSSQVLRAYVNGVQFGTANTATGTTPQLQDIVIGGRGGSNTQNDINGQVEDARIYQRELSAEEVLHIAQSQGRDGIFNGMFLWAQGIEKGEGQAVNSGDATDYSDFKHPSTTKGNGTLTYSGFSNAYTRRFK